ncbi:hypothetical protein CCY99_07865 [Helicobacter sp. 16-1353]|uniref:LysE family translocator n=1 Tax=Helicobacter sp. 16-1353 TaxID=2004996 RepID=UPI000DCB66F1|nr:LysE family translocator [Helicobacter sp. 16-1353]RAX52058.1 hypothetical protein CCY99_07865 [Helicobacter sp. 16-1353]
MNLEILFAYIFAVVLLIITPGPVVALVIRNASKYGFRFALATSIGTNLASLILISLSIAIILGAFSISPAFLSAISIFGCIFIFYLGFKSLLNLKHNNHIQESIPSQTIHKKSLKSSFFEGFGIAISNPKDIVFFVAFFPQFIHISSSIYLSLAMLVVVWILLDFGILISYSLLMQKSIFLRFNKAISVISDIVLMLVGILGLIYILNH